MSAVLQVMTPVGYELLTQSDEYNRVYSFKYDGKQHEVWYSWRLGAIDAMWNDVRARATRQARPDIAQSIREEKNTITYAVGYADGKFHVMEAIKRKLTDHGYGFEETDPVAVIAKLLNLLDART